MLKCPNCKESERGLGVTRERARKEIPAEFWERKLAEENRTVLGDATYSGKITKYTRLWGFILPDDFESLLDKVKARALSG